VLPFGRLWYGEPNAIRNAIGYAKFRSRSHSAVIRFYNDAGNAIETHEHAGDFKDWLVAIPRRHAHTSSLGFHTQLSDQHFQASAGRDTNRLAVLQ
jgi:hypothetical protein